MTEQEKEGRLIGEGRRRERNANKNDLSSRLKNKTFTMHQAKKISTDNLLIFPLPDLELVKVEGYKEAKQNEVKSTHRILIPHDFYIGKFQVTQQFYHSVEKTNPVSPIQQR